MTQVELYAALKTLDMPVAYGAFMDTPENPAPSPPFITYQFTHSSDFMADNRNYAEIAGFDIELYTDLKDPAKEAAVEALLKELALPYRKMETWLQSEKMRQVVYEVQLI